MKKILAEILISHTVDSLCEDRFGIDHHFMTPVNISFDVGENSVEVFKGINSSQCSCQITKID